MTGSASTPGGTSWPTGPPKARSRPRGTFILHKLAAHDAAKLQAVLADVYRDAVPDPADMTKFEWEVILRFLGASADEIAAVQKRMGRVWR